MRPAAHIQELARQVRGDTLRLLNAVEESWLLWVPPGTNNHILWHAGHALWLGGVLCIRPLRGRDELPPGWAETFGADCRPVAETTDWPGRDRLTRLLTAQLDRMIELLDAAAAEKLNAPVPPGGRGPLARWIIHGFHDEAKHQGEMKLIARLRRAGWRSIAQSMER